jgi:hypothetical protein
MIRKIVEMDKGQYFWIDECTEDDEYGEPGDFEIIRAATPAEAKSFMQDHSAGSSTYRTATCHSCGSQLDSNYDDICPECGGLICSSCGSCFCD